MLLEIIIVLLLTMFNGVLAMSELAIVSARPARLKVMAAEGSRGAEIALDLGTEPGRFLSSVQIGITLVGVLSGYGKDLMKSWERPVDSVYFIPNLKQWFVESTLYPFIGGNTVRRSASPVPGLLPGINHILPYAVPSYQADCGRDVVFHISKTCLENALDLLRVLEREYRALYGRNLTLSRLPEAVILPLCPDKGTCLHYDPNLSASVYLENDLEQLLRQYL